MSALIEAIVSKDIAKAIDLINKTSFKSKVYNYFYPYFLVEYYTKFFTYPEFISNRNILLDHYEFRDQPLHLAAQLGLTEVVVALVDAGVPVDLKDRFGHTALHIAVSHGYDACVIALVNAGADINAYAHGHCPSIGLTFYHHIPHGDDIYYTSIYIAVVTCKFETVKFLLEKGALATGGIARKHASEYVVDETICNTLMHALSENLASCGNVEENIRSAEAKRKYEIVNLLLNNGANPNTYITNAIEPFGANISVLAYALRLNADERELIVACLLLAGANIYEEIPFVSPLSPCWVHQYARYRICSISQDGKFVSLLDDEEKQIAHTIELNHGIPNKLKQLNQQRMLALFDAESRSSKFNRLKFPIEINMRTTEFLTGAEILASRKPITFNYGS